MASRNFFVRLSNVAEWSQGRISSRRARPVSRRARGGEVGRHRHQPLALLRKGSSAAPLERLVDKPKSSTVLAIYIKRRGPIHLEELRITTKLPYQQLWFFWSGSPDGNSWWLFGDALAEPALFPYEYPQPLMHQG
jgi:hypothetical protein